MGVSGVWLSADVNRQDSLRTGSATPTLTLVRVQVQLTVALLRHRCEGTS